MAERSYNDNGYNGERYERYNFDASEDDYIVSDILINLEALIQNSNSRNSDEAEATITCSYEPSWSIKARNLSEPLWHNKKKRSALECPPSPLPRCIDQMKNEGNKFEKITGEKRENMLYSPSSPLSYEPNDDNNNNILSMPHFKHKSKKRKVQDWEEHIRELEQTKQQLKLSLDNVRRYHQTLWDFHTKLKTKRDDEKNGESRRKNLVLKVNGEFDLNFQTGHHQLIVKGGDSQKFKYQFVEANAKVVQAAEARLRRKIKINTKRNSTSLGIRRSSIT